MQTRLRAMTLIALALMIVAAGVAYLAGYGDFMPAILAGGGLSVLALAGWIVLAGWLTRHEQAILLVLLAPIKAGLLVGLAAFMLLYWGLSATGFLIGLGAGPLAIGIAVLFVPQKD